MNFPMFMTPIDIQRVIGMPEDVLWECIQDGLIGCSYFKNIALIETSEIIDLIKNCKTVADSNAYDYEDGYYEQDAVEFE